ncbi:MAG: cytochrome c oxidase assembly protein [Chloroflexi bacterium]|nr:cytochrome c oxidase assembly protein [Chloroflexota bacterium]
MPSPILMLQTQPIPDFSWTSWSGDSTLRAGLVLLAGVYLLGIGPLRTRYRLGPPVSKARIACYLLGVLVLFMSLEGPIHELSDSYLFSAHMVQHMLITYAGPPLLLLGMPAWLIRPVFRLRGVGQVARFVTRPILAAVIFNFVFAAYHLPQIYDTIQADHTFHIAAHLAFIVLATIAWWPVLSPLPELPALTYPLRMVYVFAQTLSGFLVGSFLSNAQTPVYTAYALAPRVMGLSLVDDQRLGGLIMWVIGGLYLLLVYSAIFFVWVNAEHVNDDVALPPEVPSGRRPPIRPLAASASAPAAASMNGPSVVEEASGQATASSSAQAAAPTTSKPPRKPRIRHVVSSAPDRSRLN